MQREVVYAEEDTKRERAEIKAEAISLTIYLQAPG